MKRVLNTDEIENKWQKIWNERKVFEVTEDKTKKKFYNLEYYLRKSNNNLLE